MDIKLVLFLYLFLSMGIPFLILCIFRKIFGLEKKRVPFTGQFLRSPGESIHQQIQDLNEDIINYAISLFLAPIIILSIILILNIGKFNFPTLFLSALISLSFIFFFTYKLWPQMKLRMRLRLGYDGEISVKYKEGRP